MIKLRRLELDDLDEYKYWKQPFHAYHLLNGPYFKKATEEAIDKQITLLKKRRIRNSEDLDKRRIISNNKNEIIGEVSWYWKSEETLWMEIGIVIFDEKYWNKGIGYYALKLWIDQLFNEHKAIVRLGLSTWSGNEGMIKLSQKLGMKKEAEYRNARIVNGKYFDSISFGILRKEWECVK